MSKLDVHFEYSFLDQTLKELENLDPKKVSQVNDIPVKVIILASLYIISSVTHLTNKIHFLLYLKGRKQIIKIISSCSLFAEIFGVPVRSILGPLLFNIYI